LEHVNNVKEPAKKILKQELVKVFNKYSFSKIRSGKISKLEFLKKE